MTTSRHERERAHPVHENGSSWLATRPRTERMNAKAAKVAKGAATAAQLIATLAVTRGGQLGDLRGLCVHRRGCDRSLTRPWGEQSVSFSEQDAEFDFVRSASTRPETCWSANVASGGSRALGGKPHLHPSAAAALGAPHRRAESRPGHGPGRRCAHLPGDAVSRAVEQFAEQHVSGRFSSI